MVIFKSQVKNKKVLDIILAVCYTICINKMEII